jgi:hypothetical protein
MYFRRKTSAGRAYLQIVESRRDGTQVRQQVIATLGRFEELQASGQLERLVRSGARFAAKAMVLSAASDEAAIKIAVNRIGPALVFERLWEETGCRTVITELAGKRKHGFALERAVFLTVLHRLFVSGVAGRGTAGEGPGRAHAFCPALPQGRGGGATIRASARPAHAA